MYLDVNLPGEVAAIETWPLLGSRPILDLFREKPDSCDHLPPGETAQHLTANPATLLFLARNPAVFLVTESPERLLLYAEGATSAQHFHAALARVSGAWEGFADALQQPVQFVWRVSRALLEVHENFFSSSDVDEQARACCDLLRRSVLIEAAQPVARAFREFPVLHLLAVLRLAQLLHLDLVGSLGKPAVAVPVSTSHQRRSWALLALEAAVITLEEDALDEEAAKALEVSLLLLLREALFMIGKNMDIATPATTAVCQQAAMLLSLHLANMTPGKDQP